ncbi:large-conductance mechanosensitive channel protein MscL [Dysgonomonas sp. 521]|uniref:large-conductance mechanosensitive channel protein MscL n=1 Tax=Dysgonomonas sp. 521 TaxID=2302932 RepID=UPI0013D6DB83|nr:large-conductance mechanosensitive channel protein MscL [Dysgonomonas sp. 521]NDV96802.1 large-conductance mechanosensitive channel protein MscL [Dysgonomonas sp. 521]
MSVLKELKAFMMRGNVVDMAVGVIVGGAFGKIVSSLVSDVIMPPIGVILGGVNFSELKIVLKHAVGDTAAVTINYGTFIQTVFDFVIIATAIFFAVKAINMLQKKKEEEPAAPPAPTNEEVLLTEIRDLLKEQNKK